MKKFILLAIVLFSINSAKSQTMNCGNFCVLNISIDTVNNELDVTIYNGDTNHVNYPIVVVTNAAGDTVGNINNSFFLFAQLAGDTVVHQIPTTLDSLAAGFTGTVYLTDPMDSTTCMFSYPMSCTVGVNEIAAFHEVSVYPNPASDQITIDLHKIQSQNASIRIFDTRGALQKSYYTSESQLLINRDGLGSGMYFVVIIAGNERFTNKLIIK
jgi:hypothetical protein